MTTMKAMTKISLTIFVCIISLVRSGAQILTAEDSLNAGLQRKFLSTYISGYGEALYTADLQTKVNTADLRRNILFVGHRFNDKIQFFSEMELEHAMVTSEEANSVGGELAMEQLFLKFNLNKNNYITTGLFIPRIGIINENHLPTTFNGNDRHQVEQQIIPSTWREIGIGLYSNVQKVPGLNLSIAVMNGLNSAGFESGSGIRKGRSGGHRANSSNLAITGAALYYIKNWRLQMSGYFGGSAGITKREADSLQLSYGTFGTPVALAEMNVQYLSQGFTFKALATGVSIPDASSIIRAYASNTPELMAGCFAEVGYNLFHLSEKWREKNLTVYGRYEWLDLNVKTPDNGIINDAFKKAYIVAGVNYAPVRGIALKLDYTHRFTGEPNPVLMQNPFPQTIPYYTSNGFVNLGMAYSF
ncbi:MAG: hypothetical protein K1X54_08535 [Flavobacteriales bacterium]|nr:hypothetical protein [Flavobacteriales bacterium]